MQIKEWRLIFHNMRLFCKVDLILDIIISLNYQTRFLIHINFDDLEKNQNLVKSV